MASFSRTTNASNALASRLATPPPLITAYLVVALFHASLLLTGTYQKTYDAWVHIFFADHYQRGWLHTWEPRWYTGFSTVSYPPGTHQLLAILGFVFSLPGAFIVLGTLTMFGLVTGVYRSAQIWVDRESAAYAALLAAVSSSIAEVLHVFGQMPTLVALAFALNGLPSAYRWVRDGRWRNLAEAIAFAAATTAVHHVTTLFGVVFILSPVLVRPIFTALRTPLPGEPPSSQFTPKSTPAYVALRMRRVLPTLTRAVVYLGFVMVTLVLVVLPYWLYSSRDPITQIAIPHGSRVNFITHPNEGLMFFAIPWGLLILTYPYAIVRGLFGRAWPLMSSVLLLTLLGTGGTTPIPRMLLGGAFEILTLDRFTFWATILILPLSGMALKSLLTGGTRELMARNFGVRTGRSMTAAVIALFIGFTIFSATLGRLRPLQPDPIDMKPIVTFLAQDRHDQWRYLTLGFGDQMAWLSAQTPSETVDGNYHSARRLPELTSRPVERLEGAKYTGIAGLGSLQQFLSTPEKFHLKFVFSNDKFYDPLLWASGWQQLEPLENGIRLWQRDDVTPLPPDRVSYELPMWQRLMWGILPPVAMLAGLIAAVAIFVENRRPRRVVAAPWVPGPVGWMWRHLDDRLQRRALTLSPAEREPFWDRWDGLTGRGRRLVASPVSDARMLTQRMSLIALAAILLAPALIATVRSTPVPPAEVVFNYYTALDVRDVDGAFAMIDPNTVSSYDQYLAEYRQTSGLVSSYAHLESMDPPEVVIAGRSASVTTVLRFLTPIERYDLPITAQLRLVDGRWLLRYVPIDFTVPPDPFTTRPTVDYLVQGRRQPSAGLTAAQDVLVRPRLDAPQASLALVDGDLSVVGEVTNIDAVPAYLTVSAILYDERGVELAAASNGAGSHFTALAGETVPFRIDFEGVAGTDGSTNMNFEPGSRTKLAFDPQRVATVDLTLQSLVTPADLQRDAEFNDIARVDNVLTFDLFNTGTTEMTVTQMFATLRDDSGRVRWVDNAFAPQSVSPLRSKPQLVVLTEPTAVQGLEAQFNTMINSVPSIAYRSTTDPVSTWSAVDLSAMSFTRTVG